MSPTHKRVHQPWPGLIEAYRDRLPMAANWTPVTLLEGATPLVPAPRISEDRLYSAFEGRGLNPPGRSRTAA